MEQLTFDDLFEDTKETHTNNHEIIIPTLKKYNKTFPINLVIDFNRFMDYLAHHSVQLTKTMGYMSVKHLPLINDRLSVKSEEVTSKSQQAQYPYIHFFYHLALSGHLIEKESNQLKFTERWTMYKALADTEKYFFLLETFWVDLDWARLLDHDRVSIHLVLSDVLEKLLDEKSGHLLQLKDKEPMLANLMFDWHYFLLYVEWLGLWVCEKDQEKIDAYGKKSCYFAQTITLSPFGKKMIPIFMNARNIHTWNIPLRRKNGEINPIPGSELPEHVENQNKLNKSSQTFYEAFVHLFPKGDLLHTLPRQERKFVDGMHTFKVTFDHHVWRKVVLSAKHTMEDLHQIIMKAFNFDDDHLYSFFMDGRKWSYDCIASPKDHSGQPNAVEVTIGSVGMRIGQRFMYLYDYGDEWTFTVTVENIQATEPGPMKPFIKEEKGNGPEQYD